MILIVTIRCVGLVAPRALTALTLRTQRTATECTENYNGERFWNTHRNCKSSVLSVAVLCALGVKGCSGSLRKETELLTA